MFAFTGDGSSCVRRGASRMLAHEPKASSAGARSALRLFAVTLMAATLAGCASSGGPGPGSLAASRQSWPEPSRQASVVTTRRVAVANREAPLGTSKRAAGTQGASQGLASYYGYGHGTRTASGEKFDAGELTAAHPTLPFGTRVRVTDVATGRSVTVRVNDRGPFVGGRVIDVSHAAAQELGMVGRGVAKVKVDVVQ
jgi:rare lipoprotein A